MTRHNRQAGLSLVELMIALALSSFLILGVTQIFLDNKRTYVFQQNQAGNQENSRYALNFLEQELAKAGYRRDPTQDPAYAYPANSTLSGCSFAAGASVAWNNSAKALCIRYQVRDPNERDCQGNGLSAAEKTAVSEAFVKADAMFIEKFTYNASNKSLSCASSRGSAAADRTTGQDIVTGVAALRFEFGTGPDTTREVTAYALTPADTIRSIGYAILLQSQNQGVRENTENPVLTQWKSLYGGDAEDVTDSRQIYQIAKGRIALRNLMP
ncbi:PilW family protein [Pseudomonas sp. MT3]|nr:prepilin-type N-terminal cleavage/methylation domain-containing protein [uncultured Pseudomonas sp.]